MFPDFSQISSKFAEIVLRFSRQGNCIPSAAIVIMPEAAMNQVNPIFHFKAPAQTVRGIAIKLRLACRDEDDSAVLAVLADAVRIAGAS